MNDIAAIVKSLVGQVFAVSLDGLKRQIFEGERLLMGEQLLTGLGGEVTLQLASGEVINVGQNSGWQAAPVANQATDDTTDPTAGLEQALAAGFDPTTDLEAPAAGPGAGGGTGGAAGGGHSFVLLDETGQQLDPTVGFETAGLGLAGQTVDEETAAATADAVVTEGIGDPVAPPVNTAPAAQADAFTINEDGSISIDALSNDSDLDGDTLTITAVEGQTIAEGSSISVNNGTVTLTSGQLVFTPDSNYNGPVSFSYTISDGIASSTASITGTVTPVNDAPIAVDDSLTATEDTPVIFTAAQLTGNDTDTEGSPLTINSVTSGSNGSAALNANGTVTFTPNANFKGSADFTYTVTDGQLTSNVATATVTVGAVNDPTTFGGDTAGSAAEDTSITGTLTVTDADGLTDGTYFTVTGNASNGTASINAANGAWTYTPNADYNGADSFTVTVTDDANNTTTQVINLTVSPVADIVADTLTTTENNAVTANVLTGTNGASADNFEGTPILTSVTNGANGSVTFTAGGAVTYTPNANFNGADSFTYTVTSGGVTESTTVNVNVANPTIGTVEPGAPSVTDDNVNEGQTLTFNVSINGTSTAPVSYALTLGGTATAGSDYNATLTNATFTNGVTYNSVTGLVTVPAGVTGFAVSVPTLTDTVSGEPVETVILSIGGVSGTGGIIDTTAAPTIGGIEPGAVGPAGDTVNEGDKLVFNVSVTGTSTTATTFAFALGGGTATAGSDYTNAPTFSNGVTYNSVAGTISVPAGVTSFSVTVPTLTDSVFEGPVNETVPLAIGGVSATGGIIDTTSTPTIRIIGPGTFSPAGDPAGDTVIEGDNLVFNVSVTGTSTTATTFAFALGGGTATAGSDFTNTPTLSNGVAYNSVAGTISLPPGVTSFTVTVPTLTDSVFEGPINETVPLTIGGVSATGGIIDTTAAPRISTISSPTANEGSDLVYDITLSNASSSTTSLAYSLGGGSANPTDLGTPTFSNGVTLVGGNLIVPAGVTRFSLTLPTADDAFIEPTETVPLTIGGVNATGSITDNDVTSPTLSISTIGQWTFNEGSGATTNNQYLNKIGSLADDNISGGSNLPSFASPSRNATAGNNLNFQDAGDRVNIDKSVTQPLMGTATLAFWINTTQQGGGNGAGNSWSLPTVIGSEQNGGTNDIQWGAINNEGKIGFGIGNVAGVYSTSIINNGTWQHIAITRNATTKLVEIYVNGVREASGSPSDPGFTATINKLVSIGASNNFSNNASASDIADTRYFNGQLDDLRIYSGVLTQSQITAIRNVESGFHDTALANDGGNLKFSLTPGNYASLAISGLEAGMVISDGTQSVSASGDQQTINLTGWNLSSLSISNTGTASATLAITATNTVAGDSASTTSYLTIANGQSVLTNGTGGPDTLTGSNGADLIRGGEGNDNINGGSGNDRIEGGNGNDTLLGDAGNDVIFGGAGNDFLVGGSGNDTLWGGNGADTFAWQLNNTGQDVIKDFKPSEGDCIDLRDLLQGENEGNILNFLRVDTSTSTLLVSRNGVLNTSGDNADVTIRLENDHNPVNVNPGNLSQVDLVNSLIAGADPIIKVDHTL
jgi:hypothetical protein